MSFALTDNSLVGPVAETLAREVNGMPAKEAARLLGTSLPTITRIRRGEMPSAGVLLAAIKFFGVRILEPVIGKFDDASLVRRLDAIEGLLKEVRHDRSQPAASSSSAHRDVGAAGRAGDRDRGRALELVRPDWEALHQESAPAALALVQVRRPLDGLTRAEGAQLSKHLTSNVYSLDAARAYKAAHPDVGIAYKPPGMDWLVDPSDSNRLWVDHGGLRPLTAFPFPEHVDPLRKGFEEAARSVDPILIEHTGYLRGEHIHATVLRFGGIANDGTELCLAAHARSA